MYTALYNQKSMTGERGKVAVRRHESINEYEAAPKVERIIE
jgi:hypothetical protein